MSLSKFYKTNAGFKARAILDSITSASNGPVWESIVKEELEEESSSSPQIVPPSQKDLPDLDDEVKSGSKEGLEIEPPPLQEDSPQEHSPPSPVQPPEPVVDVEAIRNDAYLDGITEGRKQAEEDFENSSQTLINICQELNHLRETILRNSTEEMKELVLGISEKIIRHSVTIQHDTIIETIKDAIQLAVQSDAFQIRLNPADLKAVEARKNEIIESISSLDNIVLKADPSVDPGGCLLESSCCTVDASLTSQIKVIHEAIMKDESLIGSSGSK